MNRTFKSIWNESTGTFVAVAENVKSQGKRTSSSRAGAIFSAVAAVGLGAGMAVPNAIAVVFPDTITADNNITVTKSPTGFLNAFTDYKIGLSNTLDLTNAGSVTIGAALVDAAGLTITGGPSITTLGLDGGGSAITSVGDGVNADDAVNKRQLDADKTHYYSVNDGGTPQGNHDNLGATGTDSLAAGIRATATADRAVAMGTDASATGEGATALGSGAQAFDIGATAVGFGARADKYGATASGAYSKASGTYSTAQGFGSEAIGDNAVAIGSNTKATLAGATAVGNEALAKGVEATAVGNKAKAGRNSVALGNNADALNSGTVALGTQSFAGQGATVVGTNAKAGGQDSTALGRFAQANDADSVALGSFSQTAAAVGTPNILLLGETYNFAGATPKGTVSVGSVGNERTITNLAAGRISSTSTDAVNGSQLDATNKAIANIDFPIRSSNAQPYTTSVTGTDALAVGSNAIANGDRSTAVGENAKAIGIQASAFGAGAEATARSSLAAGFEAKAKGGESVALGVKSNAEGLGATAVGPTANARGENSAALGRRSKADGVGAMALGGFSKATGENATAAGFEAEATGVKASAFGSKAQATMAGATAIGNEAFAKGVDATAVGNKAKAGRNSVALGRDADALNSGTVALGTQSFAGQGATVVGTNATASGQDSTALGRFAQANDADSVALGSFSQTTTAVGTAGIMLNGSPYSFAGAVPKGTVSVGSVGNERTITNLAAGRISSTSTDAINGSQLHATNTAVEDLNDTVVANKTHYYSVNDGGTQQANYNNDGATGNNSLAAGVDATATADRAVAMGTGASATGSESTALGSAAQAFAGSATAVGFGARADQYGTTAMGTSSRAQAQYSTAVGHEAKATGVRAVALGKDAEANDDSATALGSAAQAFAGSATAVGFGARADQYGATATGTNSRAQGEYSSAFGQEANAAGNRSVAIGKGASASDSESTALGSAAQAFAGSATAVGFGARADQYGATAMGTSSRAQAQYSTAVGHEAKATGVRAVALGKDAEANDDSATALGSAAQAFAGSATAVGFGARADQYGATALGVNSRAQGMYSTAVGQTAEATGENSIAMGHGAQAGGVDSIAIGTGNQVTGDHSGAFGDPNIVSGTGSYAFGNNNTIANNNTFVVGNNVTTTQDNSVVLGDGSADRPATFETGTLANPFAGSAPVGVVSVGSAGGERQIINVAAGAVNASSTDAINGSQLHATNEVVNQGFGLKAADGNTVMKPLGAQVEVIGSNSNITTKVVGGKVAVDLNNNLDLGTTGSVKMGRAGMFGLGPVTTVNRFGLTTGNILGNTRVNGLGVLVNDPFGSTALTANGLTITGGPSVTRSGINAGNKRITNVTAGINGTDGVNVSQLTNVAAAAKTEVEAGTNVTVNNTPGANGQNVYTINADGTTASAGSTAVTVTAGDKDLLTNLTDYEVDLSQASKDSLVKADNSVQYDNPAQTSVTLGGVGSATPVTLTNVAAGTTEFDAVNFGQLEATNTVVNKGFGLKAADGNTVMKPLGEQVEVVGSNNNITTKVVGGKIAVALNNNLDLGTTGSVKMGRAGMFGLGPVTTINSLGFATGNVLGSTAVTGAGVIVNGPLGIPSTTLTANGLNIIGGPSVTKSGINAGSKRITDVAAGINDTDAVNVSQLNGVSQDIENLGDRAVMYDGNVGDPKDTITLAGTNGTKITNLTDGDIAAGSKDAVNGGQISDMGDSIAAGMGGDSKFENGKLVTDLNVAGTSYTNVNDALGGVHSDLSTQITNVEGIAGAGWNVTDADNNSANIGPNGQVAFIGDQNVTVKQTGIKDKGQVEVTLNQDLKLNSITAVKVSATNVTADDITINNGGPIINSSGIDMRNKQITNVGAGVAPTDAINVSQLSGVKTELHNEINSVRRDLHKVDRKLRAGVAAAMATAGLPQAYAPGKSMVAMGGGTWNGESGLALGVSKITDNGKWVFKASGNASTRGDYGGTVGAGYQW